MRIAKLSGILILLYASTTLAWESESIALTIRANYSHTSPKQKGLPAPNAIFATNKQAKLISPGIGGEAAVTMFLTDHFAGELGSGLTMYRTKRTGLYDMQLNYSTNLKPNKKKDLYAIPSYAMAQYHIAPYGAIRPYVGAGYHYTYMIAKAQQYEVKNAGGLAFQAGVNFVLKDDTYLNIDVKHYLLKTSIRYNKGFISYNNNQITSTVKMNPTVIALGVGLYL